MKYKKSSQKYRYLQKYKYIQKFCYIWLFLFCLTGPAGSQAVSAITANSIVRGLVLDEFGFPVPGAVVSLYTGDTLVESVSVDGTGWYRFSVDTGVSRTCTAEASGEGFISEKKQLEVRPGVRTGVDFFLLSIPVSNNSATVTIRYSPGGLEGEVTDQSGAPLTQGWITLYESNNGETGIEVSDDPAFWYRLDYRILDRQGGFRFSAVSERFYLVRAFLDDYPVSEALTVQSDKSGRATLVVTKRTDTGQVEALRWLNWHRIQAGLVPVRYDNELNRQTQLHAEYHVSIDKDPMAEGLGAHFEYPGRPRFTNEGLVGGLSSNGIPGDMNPRESIDSWINTLYHRIGPLNPSLRTTGFARLTTSWLSGRGTSRKSGIEVVRYPADGQIGVPTEFSGHEMPAPLPPGVPLPVGYVITLHFTGNPIPSVTQVEAGLEDIEGKEVPLYISWPEKPANASFPQDGVVCLIPRSPLESNLQYVVRVSGRIEGELFTDAWTFSTGDFVRPLQPDKVAPPEQRPEVVLESLPHLSGRVTDGTGNPVTNGWVALFRSDEQVGFSWLDAEDGSYETGIVPPGDYQVKVHPGISHYAVEEGISLTTGHIRRDYTVDLRDRDMESLGVAFGKPVGVSYAQMPYLGSFVVDGESVDSHGIWIADPFGTILDMMNLTSLEKPESPHWIEIDLEETMLIDRMHLFLPWWVETPQLYQISVSADRVEWTAIVDNNEEPVVPTANGEAFQFAPIETRFVQLEIMPTTLNTSAMVLELRVFRAGSHTIDGILDDTKDLPGVQSVSDPRGDTIGPGGYDLRTLYAVLHGRDLVLATDHYEKARDPRQLHHTIHIQAFDPVDGKFNYWIQSNYWSWAKISRYRDGMPVEEWEEIRTAGALSWYMGQGGEWKMPRALFGDADVLKIKVIDAGYDQSGTVQHEGDSSPWLIMDLSPVTIVTDPRIGRAEHAFISTISDPEKDNGEGSGGYDIKEVSIFDEDGYLFIATRYHGSVRSLEDAIHTFVIRSYGGDSPGIWLHLGPGWMTIKEIRDGIPWEEWPDIQVDRSAFSESNLIYENGEWGIPLALLGNPPLVSLRYSVGIEQWDADSIESYKLKTSLAEPDGFYADGDLTDLLSLSGLTSIEDPRGDAQERNSFDIKTLYGAMGDASLILGADFHRIGEPPEQLQQTIHIQAFGRQKMNYWIASGLAGWVTLYRFRDGAPFEEWEELPIPSDFDWGLFPQGIEWKIPLDLFSGSDRLAVMYMSGGYDRSGEIVWQSDSTDWMELDLRGTGR